MIDVQGIYRIARRKIRDPILAEDVAQTACLHALTNRPTRPWLHVADAIRTVIGRRGQAARYDRPDLALDHPEWIASHYPTLDQLCERWMDEESEDQADEWRRVGQAERARRATDADRALGTSAL